MESKLVKKLYVCIRGAVPSCPIYKCLSCGCSHRFFHHTATGIKIQQGMDEQWKPFDFLAPRNLGFPSIGSVLFLGYVLMISHNRLIIKFPVELGMEPLLPFVYILAAVHWLSKRNTNSLFMAWKENPPIPCFHNMSLGLISYHLGVPHDDYHFEVTMNDTPAGGSWIWFPDQQKWMINLDRHIKLSRAAQPPNPQVFFPTYLSFMGKNLRPTEFLTG